MRPGQADGASQARFAAGRRRRGAFGGAPAPGRGEPHRGRTSRRRTGWRLPYTMIARFWSRAAALLAAVMLSGVPAVAAQVTSTIASCCCPAEHGRGAQCPMKKAATAPKKPCHGSSSDSRGDDGDGCPTLSSCSIPFAPTTPPPRAEVFTLLQWPPIPRPQTTSTDFAIPALQGGVLAPPETPPPRHA
jgi:hypothetical protein